MSGLPTLNFYHSSYSLLTQKKEIQASSIKLPWGHQVLIYMRTLAEEKFALYFHSKIIDWEFSL